MTWKNKHFPSADEMELKAGERRPSEERPCLLLTGRLPKLKPGRPQLRSSQSGWRAKGRKCGSFTKEKVSQTGTWEF